MHQTDVPKLSSCLLDHVYMQMSEIYNFSHNALRLLDAQRLVATRICAVATKVNGAFICPANSLYNFAALKEKEARYKNTMQHRAFRTTVYKTQIKHSMTGRFQLFATNIFPTNAYFIFLFLLKFPAYLVEFQYRRCFTDFYSFQ